MYDVVVVEDDPDLQLISSLMLTKAGYHVRGYESPLDALHACFTTPPSVVVLDWMMPEMSGLEMLAALRDHPATRHVPVVMATALSGPENVATALRTGANGYLVKPYTQAQLVEAVSRHLVRPSRERQAYGAA